MSTERTWVGPSAPERLGILRSTRSVAIVGMSNKLSLIHISEPTRPY